MTILVPFLLPAFFLGCAVGWVFGLIECRRVYKKHFDRFVEELKILR